MAKPAEYLQTRNVTRASVALQASTQAPKMVMQLRVCRCPHRAFRRVNCAESLAATHNNDALHAIHKRVTTPRIMTDPRQNEPSYPF